MSGLAFSGHLVRLPWHRWRGVWVSPDGIHTLKGHVVNPEGLDLLLWKSAFYDRGRKAQYWPELPSWGSGDE